MLIVSTALSGWTVAQEKSDSLPPFSDSDIEFFENKVRPLLVQHCLPCHGEDEKKLRGGLRLTSHAEMLAGGDSGEAIVPGKPDESLLISSVRYEDFEMPPKGKLKQDDIDTLVEWVERGAPDPRLTSNQPAAKAIDIETGRKFWAFQPLLDNQPPEVAGVLPSDSPIDQFVQAKLAAEGIQMVADTDRATLIRRAYLALIGLPPTPQQIDAFLNDPSSTPDAFAVVVEQLLDSSHFGERWGRHWLDVARFAESSGGGRSLMFPNAWRYRDYVIDAYNKDKPFDRFINEQIAGDLMPYDSHAQKIEQIVATGFLALGPTNYEQQDKELLRMEVIDEQVDTVGRTFLGMTLGCARCHDHKFDPIPTSDYYAMAGIFGATTSLVDGNVSSPFTRPIETQEVINAEKKYRAQVDQLTKKHSEIKSLIRGMGGETETASRNRQNRKAEKLAGIVIDNEQAKLIGNWKRSTSLSPFVDAGYVHDSGSKIAKSAIFLPKFEVGGRYEVRMSYSASGNRASNVPVTIDHQDGKAHVIINQSQTPPIDGLFISLGTYRFEANNRSTVTISNDNTDGHVIVDAVQFLKIDDVSPAVARNEDTPAAEPAGQSGAGKEESEELLALRKQLSNLDRQLKKLKSDAPRPIGVAMSVQDNPTPTDGHIHIRGSVRNLGPVVPRGFISVCSQNSSTPSLAKDESGRLQLAEWIASPEHPLTARVYVNRVWRHLFGRGLVETTDNFGAMGAKPSHPELLDFLAREFTENNWSTKNLIRQIMLSRVYRLSTDGNETGLAKDDQNRLLWRANRRRVDAEVLRDSILFVSGQLDLKAGGRTIRKISQYDLNYKFNTNRRSVYVPAFRNSMLDLFEAFDFANPNLVVGNRNTSTLPTQALFLMNSPMVVEQSRAAAKRLLAVGDLNNEERINLAYRQVLGRGPSSAELSKTMEYLSSFGAKKNGNEKEVELRAWASVWHALFASLDFRYVN